MVSYWDNFKNWLNNLNPAPNQTPDYPLGSYINPQTQQSIQVKKSQTIQPPESTKPPIPTQPPVSTQPTVSTQPKDYLTSIKSVFDKTYSLGLSVINPLGYKSALELDLDNAKVLNHEAELLYRKAEKETDIQKKKDLLLKATNFTLQASEISKNVQKEVPSLLNLPQLATAGFVKTWNIPQFTDAIQQTTRNLVENYRKVYPQYNVPTDIPIDEQVRQYSQLIRKEAEQKFGEPKIPEGYKEPETVWGRFYEDTKGFYYNSLKPGIYSTIQYLARDFNIPELSTNVEKLAEEAYAYGKTRADLRVPEELSDLPHLVESFKKDPLKTIAFGGASFFANALPYTLTTILAEMVMPGGGTAFIYSLEKGNFQRDLLDKGVDYEHADAASNLYGILSAAIENMSAYTPKGIADWISKKPVQNLLKQSWKNVLAQLPKATVKTLFNSIEEGNEEVYQEIAGRLIERWLNVPQNKEDIIPQLAYEWIGGFVGSIPLGATQFDYHPEIPGLSVRSIEPESLLPEGEPYKGQYSDSGYSFVGLTKNSKGRYEINYSVPFQGGTEKLYLTFKDIPSALRTVSEIFYHKKEEPAGKKTEGKIDIIDIQSDPKIYALSQTLSSLESKISKMEERMAEEKPVDMVEYDSVNKQIADIQRQIAERRNKLLAVKEVAKEEIVPQAAETPVEEKAEIPAEEKVETSLQEAKPEAKPEVKPIDINDINKNTNFNELTDSQKLGLIDEVIWRFIYRPTDKNRYGTIVGSHEDNNYKISEQLLDNIVGYYENLHNASNPILPKEHPEEIEKGLDLIKKIINEIQDENTKSQLTTLYNKIVKTPKLKPEVKPEVQSIPKELEPLAKFGDIKDWKTKIGNATITKSWVTLEGTEFVNIQLPSGRNINIEYDILTGKKQPISAEQSSFLKDLILGEERLGELGVGIHRPAVGILVEQFKAKSPSVMERPIAMIKREGKISILEGEHRFAAAKIAGVEPPMVLLTEKQTADLNASQIDALAKKVYTGKNTKELTDFYNQEATKGIKEAEPEVKPEVPQPTPTIAPEAPESPTRGGLPERGIKQPPKPKEGAKPKKSLPKEEKLEVVSNVTVGDKLDVDIEQDIKDQPVTVVKEDGSEETLEIPTEPVEIYNSEWRKVKTTDPIAIMRWNEIKKNLDDLLTTFKQAIPDLKELKATQKELVSSLRDIQLAKLDEIFAEAKDINEFQQRLGELSETAGKSVSEKVQKLFDGDTLNKAFSVIQYFSGNDWLKLSALKAFLDLSTGHTAYASGYQAIAKIFGPEFSLQIKQLFPLSTSEKVLYFISAVYNVPRSWLAGFFDLSATQVQLLLATAGHPIAGIKALGAGIKAFAGGFIHPSEQALAIQSIWQDPDMKRLVYEAKISFTNPFGVGGEKFQEPFIGLSILEKVPVVRRIVGGTAAAFDTQVSLMQYYLGKTYLKVLEAAGEVTKENLESMGRFINDITGRANIPRSLKKINTILNYGFFSPRMLIATFDTLNPVMYVKLPKELRKYAARMWLIFLSMGFLKLFGARMLGAEDTTKDPTSADFLKIKIGGYRNNPFGKYQAIAVLLARIIKGEFTSSTTGMKQPVGWAPGYQGTSYAELITRFFASREHPTAAYLVDAIKGQTEEGLPFRWGPETLKLFIPMFFADTTELLYEARKNNWSPVLTLFATIDSFLGAPSQTYGGYIPAMFQDPNTGKYTLKLIQYPQTQEVVWSKVFKQPLTQFDPKDWEYVTNKYRADQAKSYLSKTFNSLMTQVENGKLTPDEAYKKWQEMTKALNIPISYTNTDPNNPYLQEYNRLLTKGEKVPTLDFKFYQGLDAQDIVAYNKNLDDLRNRALQAVISSPNYQKMPDEYKSKLLTNVINEVEQQYNLNCIKNILSNIPKESIPDALIELKRSGLMTESIFNQLQKGL